MSADRLNATRDAGHVHWLPAGSSESLRALAAGHCHCAGIHFSDSTTSDKNTQHVREISSQGSYVLITLAHWEAGLLMRHEDARRITGTQALDDPRLRWIAREPGSGAQTLLSQHLPEAVNPATMTAFGHLEVAHAIARGIGDVGVATRDAALAYGLHFLPLAHERYDLVVAQDTLTLPQFARMINLLHTATMRNELAALAYDTRQTGMVAAEVRCGA